MAFCSAAEQFEPSSTWPAGSSRASRPRPATCPQHSTAATASTESPLTAHLATVDAAVAFVSRRKLLSADEREELRSCVYVKLLENDCGVLRQFRGESQLRTFLFVVVDRVLIDLRNAKWGKWRPSAAARRLGDAAVRLEELVGRDGMSRDEAEAVMRRDGEWPLEPAHQRRLDQLPARPPRRFVDVDCVAGLQDESADPEARLVDSGSDSRRHALRRVLAALEATDRTLLRLRFDDHLPVCQIASHMGITTTAAYRRLDAIYRRLRTTLGVRRPARR
jgi:RNA polymerase sigma factor (sigma-70 family)